MTNQPAIPRVFFDFETQSRAKLKDIGGRLYSQDPSTKPLCAVLWVEGAPGPTRWIPGDPEPELPERFIGVAHNVWDFDRHIWRLVGWPEPEHWVDTADLARMGGWPKATLDFLTQTLLSRPKDKDGNALTLRMSRVRKDGTLPVPTAEQLDRILEYCERDVIDLVQLWGHLAQFERNEIPGLHEVDRAIVERGIGFDTELAGLLLKAIERVQWRALSGANTTADVVRSVPKLTAAFGELGVSIPNAQKATMHELRSHADPRVAALANARLSTSVIAKGKLEAGLACTSPDGRLRDSLLYYGAHTGRWSGRKVQTQNLPVGATEDDAGKAGEGPAQALHAACVTDPEVVKALLRSGSDLVDMKTINTMTRACLMAAEGHTFSLVDYSSIEARVLRWMSNDTEALEAFRNKDDPYKRFAAKLFVVDIPEVSRPQRKLGKGVELGCQFGMGWKNLKRTVEKHGGNWDKIPVTPQQCVNTWRDTHRPIVEFWGRLEKAALAAARGGFGQCWPTQWARLPDGDSIACRLPSGRCLRYPQVKLGKGRFGRPELSYLGKVEGKVVRVHTYGGSLAENVTQAVARDLQALALMACEREGLRPVTHTHDEIVCEVPVATAEESARRQAALMVQLPEWATGLPIDVEGFIVRRYRK